MKPRACGWPLVAALTSLAALPASGAQPEGGIHFQVSRNGILVENLWPDGAQLVRLVPDLLIPANSAGGLQAEFGRLDEAPVVVELDGNFGGQRYVVQGRRPTLVPAAEVFGVRCEPCELATSISYLTSYTVEIEKRSKHILAFELAQFCRAKRREDGVPEGLADRECHDLKLRDIRWDREGSIVGFEAEVDGKPYRYP